MSWGCMCFDPESRHKPFTRALRRWQFQVLPSSRFSIMSNQPEGHGLTNDRDQGTDMPAPARHRTILLLPPKTASSWSNLNKGTGTKNTPLVALRAWSSCLFCRTTKIIDPQPKQQVKECHDRSHWTTSLTLWPANDRPHKSPYGPKSHKGNNCQDNHPSLLSRHKWKQAQCGVAKCDDGKNGHDVS